MCFYIPDDAVADGPSDIPQALKESPRNNPARIYKRMRHLHAYDLFIPTIELTDIRLVSKREAFPEHYALDEARSSDTVRVFKENLEAMGMNARESGQSIKTECLVRP